MAPQKYSSVRYKSRPTALVPFRDDTSLIALRYDQTVQAEPPIPIPPPRSPLRNNRSTIAIAGASVTRPSSTVSSSLSSNNIAAPSLHTPPQPSDTHPALRAATTPRTTASDLQRQSGRAASSKSPTVHEESEEEDPFTYKKFESIAIRAAPDPSVSSASDSTTFTIPKLRVKTGAHSPSQHSDCEITRSLNGANDRCSQCSIPLPSPGLSEDNNTASPTSPTTPPSAAECFPEKPASILSKPSIFRSPPSISLPSMKPKKLQKKAHPAQQVHQVDDHDMALDVETSLVGKDATAPVVRSASNRAPIPQWKSPAPVPAPVVDVPPPHLAHGAAKQPDTGVSSSLKTATIPRVEDDEFSQFITQMSFSKRGSIMLAGKKPDLVATLDAGANRDGVGYDAPVSEQPSPPRMHPLGPSLMPKSQGDGTPFTAPRTSPTIPTIIAEEEPSPCPSPSDAEHEHEHEQQQPLPSSPPAAIATPPAPAQLAAAATAAASPEAKLPPTPTTPQSPPCIRVIPVDVERESQKVRSLYEPGVGLMWEEGGRHSALSGRLEPTEEVPSDVDENDAPVESPKPVSSDPPPGSPTPQAPGTRESKVSTAWPLVDEGPKAYERAGGIEDWEDVNVEDVDRYGFIMKRRPDSRASTPADYERLGQYSPNRKRNILLRRGDMATHSAYLGSKRGPSRKMSARSLNTQASGLSTASRNSTRSALRQAANLLPHNKDRRWMDEAGDMLAPQLGLTSIGDEKSAGTVADESKYKEWGRTEKWRKMATVVKPGADGEGSFFEFDLKQPKLVDRTWKGIPDCWRSAAWWSFLSTSAKQSKERFASDDELFTIYRNLQEVPSPDDVQIDLDVPRTINQHIMFRRRYRGGQRLLFRVLHALSLYFPETGYVQGMAALGATLLSYYDEERCFVMLVRLWQVRGLNRLYSPGFVDLMDALRKFETNWLAGKDVASKLQELGIDPTAYATRWYLTLFNLSIPFPAQLRVWDVFMLLGEPSDATTPRSKPNTPEKGATHSDNSDCFDVLHATSTAIIQALRDHLIDSEFENAMKALTSWVPIKNEDLLMKVIRAEYRQHHTKKKKT